MAARSVRIPSARDCRHGPKTFARWILGVVGLGWNRTAGNSLGLNSRKDGTFCYDVLNPEFRDWSVQTVAKGVKDSGCDGAFIDQMHGSVRLRKSKKAEIEKAMGR